MLLPFSLSESVQAFLTYPMHATRPVHLTPSFCNVQIKSSSTLQNLQQDSHACAHLSHYYDNCVFPRHPRGECKADPAVSPSGTNNDRICRQGVFFCSNSAILPKNDRHLEAAGKYV